MADNYCQSSSKLLIPKEKISKAKEIIDRVSKIDDENEDYIYRGANIVIEDDGVWFYHEE